MFKHVQHEYRCTENQQPFPGPTIHGSPGSSPPLSWQAGDSHNTEMLSFISCTSISLLETSTKLYFELFDYTKDHFTGQK